jgi:2-polyprenyl-3-methyl-5-hydroxy-6-metoxy-1,4-benzoquinol methylase
MLEAHLDDTTDAASRRPAQRAAALAWIGGFLPAAGASLLDLGCGPGLYAEALARSGHAVTGLDLSASSIACARKRASAAGLSIGYRVADYLRDDLGSGYGLAMMIYCDFGALRPADESAILRRVRDALAPGGLFVFDVFGPEFGAAAKESRSWHASAGAGFWSREPHLVLEETFVYPEEGCAAHQSLVLAEGKERALYRSWDRWFTEAELARLLGEAGFRLETLRRDLVAPNDFAPSEVLFAAARRVG